jgi:hexosaminidase
MKTAAELQTYFEKRVIALVEKHGKAAIGWDEVLQPGVPKDIVIQSWRGPDSLAAAARQGYRGILSSGYYLDLMHSAAEHYAVDPMQGATAQLSPDEQKLILGGEACEWSEYVTPENIDSRIWPRMEAIAERLWSPQDLKDVNSMYARMEVESRRLQFLGLTHLSSPVEMLEQLADFHAPDGLETLAALVQPVRDYERESLRQYTSATPLNRLVDAAHPESLRAREFSLQVENWKAHEPAIRKQLTKWRAAGNKLVPVMKRYELLQEDIPLAENLAAVSAAGLEALDDLDSGKIPSPAWASNTLALLDNAAKPQAVLLLMIVPPVRKLVEAALQH